MAANRIVKPERPLIGVAVIVIRKDHVLLGKRKNAHGAGCWQFPGGHLEYGESIEACARRELMEETGMVLVRSHQGPYTNDRFEDDNKHYVTLYVIADETEGEALVKEPDKCEGWEWFPWSRLPTPAFLPIVNLVKDHANILDLCSPAAFIKDEKRPSGPTDKKEVSDMAFTQPVSVHGGHSREFCSHARDSLEAMIQAYMHQGYLWVGITEHMPPASDDFVYPEERRDGWNATSLMDRFTRYMATCRELQKRYADRIRILVGFETEYTRGSLELAQTLVNRFAPDYVVGSVHHVLDIPFDYDRSSYLRAAEHCGGMNELYATYFDHQHEMIRSLHPRVVGHLDIIRIYDPDYPSRLREPDIWRRIVRNLETIKELNLILDFNLRPLSRDEKEPYLSAPILDKAIQLGIDVVPGDDSHGINDIGRHMPAAIKMLSAAGVRPVWRMPVDDHGQT